MTIMPKTTNKKEVKKDIRLAEIRAVEMKEDNKMVIEGYAIVFNKKAEHYGFSETIDARALDETDLSDVPLRYNHKDSIIILARTRNRSLELSVDNHGLLVRATLLDIQSHRDFYTAVKEKLIDKMSFRFLVEEDRWDYEKNDRVVLKISALLDVSVVDTPFYDDTEIYARALDELESHKATLESEKKKAIEIERLKTDILRKV